MTWWARAFAGALLSIVTIGSATLHADTVQITVRDGRISLVATNATPAQIFAAWSRAGGVLIVNVERMPSAPLTLTLDNVPEEQALDTLLRSVSGYLAQRRPEPVESGSIFNRIVILPSPQMARQPAPAAGGPATASPVPLPRPAVQLPAPQNQPQGIPQGPGVIRLTGADGQPVEDDQAGAPPPYNPGDSPDTRPAIGAPRGVPVPVPVPVLPQQPPQQSPPPQSTSAPAGAPRPGMVVPAQPQDQQQQQQQQPQQPQR